MARLLTVRRLILVCIVLTVSVQGGEKVRFSDGTRIPVKPDPLTKRGVDNPFGSSLDRDSSLGGVSAIPFSPPTTPSRALSPKEKDMLDQQNNWMQRSMDDVSISEKTANEAFGVRDYQADKPDARPKRDLEKYFDKADEKAKANETEALGGLHAREAAMKTFREPKETSAMEVGSSFSPSGMARDPFSSGVSGRAALSGGPGFALEPQRMNMQDSLGEPTLAGSPRLNERAADLLQDRKARMDAFREVMNGGAVGSSKVNPLSGLTDPVNLHPDLTRDVMDPVMPVDLSGALSGTKATFSDSLRPVGVGSGFARSTVLDDLTKGQGSVSIAPSFVPINQPRRLAPSPLVLEMPKRNF